MLASAEQHLLADRLAAAGRSAPRALRRRMSRLSSLMRPSRIRVCASALLRKRAHANQHTVRSQFVPSERLSNIDEDARLSGNGESASAAF